jgi:hypothetical protein
VKNRLKRLSGLDNKRADQLSSQFANAKRQRAVLTAALIPCNSLGFG